MAFEKYETSRANIYDVLVNDTVVSHDIGDAMDKLNKFKSENHIGDVVCVWWFDTEDGAYLQYSEFNDPNDGWYCDFNKIRR